MRRHPAIGIVVLIAILSVSMAIPAAAASKTRVYKGETSQMKPFSVRVLKADDGQRYFKGFTVGIVLTCEDASTQEWGMGWFWGGKQNQLTDGVFVDMDEVWGSEALHIHGRIGHYRGSGTFRFTVAELTADEQAQVCTTGDLTWQVEYERTLSRTASVSSPALDGMVKIRVGSDGEVSRTVRRFG
jgi:hypothetical protein